jgi:hypothetical protein
VRSEPSLTMRPAISLHSAVNTPGAVLGSECGGVERATADGTVIYHQPIPKRW